MKKIFNLLICVVLLLIFTACGSDTSSNGKADNEYSLGDTIKIGSDFSMKVYNIQKVYDKYTKYENYEFNVDITSNGNYRVVDFKLLDSNYDSTKKYDVCSLNTNSTGSVGSPVSQPVKSGSYYISCPKINNEDATLLLFEVCTSDYSKCDYYYVGE